MINRQVRQFYIDKENAEHSITDRLIRGGYVQPAGGYILNAKRAGVKAPSQYWHLKDLEAMVKEVNATQVAPADKLTDSVYHYDSKEKIFELGEKFVQRQAEKEAERADERGEKSVLGDLKAKKEEFAKTTKKETIDKGAKTKGGEAL